MTYAMVLVDETLVGTVPLKFMGWVDDDDVFAFLGSEVEDLFFFEVSGN